jgi:flagellar motor switch protein FliN/FliY
MTETMTKDLPSQQSPLPSLFAQVTVELSIRVGTSTLSLADLSRLSEGSVVVLKEAQHQPLELFAGEQMIARGELEAAESGEGYTFRVTELTADLS